MAIDRVSISLRNLGESTLRDTDSDGSIDCVVPLDVSWATIVKEGYEKPCHAHPRHRPLSEVLGEKLDVYLQTYKEIQYQLDLERWQQSIEGW